LKDYLYPDNPDLTVEGYPAPKRAIILADAP
jgi:tRNA (mo5U34)-methyltransferase